MENQGNKPDFNELYQEFQQLRGEASHHNYFRLKEIYKIFSKHSSDLFLALNEHRNQLNQIGEITHENIDVYGLYDAKVSSIDQFGVRLNIDRAKFQAKVDTHHLHSYENYKRTKVNIGDKMKIIIVTHKLENNKWRTNAVFQKYPLHETIFRFYEFNNKGLTLDNIQIGGFYKGFINGVSVNKDNPSKSGVFVSLTSDISGLVNVRNINEYEIGRIVDVKITKKLEEKESKRIGKESREGKFEFYI